MTTLKRDLNYDQFVPVPRQNRYIDYCTTSHETLAATLRLTGFWPPSNQYGLNDWFSVVDIWTDSVPYPVLLLSESDRSSSCLEWEVICYKLRMLHLLRWIGQAYPSCLLNWRSLNGRIAVKTQTNHDFASYTTASHGIQTISILIEFYWQAMLLIYLLVNGHSVFDNCL